MPRIDKSLGKFRFNSNIEGTERSDLLFGNSRGQKIEGFGGNDVMYGLRGQDKLYGGNGDDGLFGGRGKDGLYGGNGDDGLWGGNGRDFLEGGIGNDFMSGGRGRDKLLSISWAGEPEIAQDVPAGVDKVEPGEPIADDDVLTGGKGRDKFEFRWLIDAKDEILDKHRDDNGNVDYRAVAGENGAPHDHWVEAIGNDTVTDFNENQDTLVFQGHTVTLDSASMIDADGDGQEDDTLLVFYSEQGGAGAHQDDALGTVTLLNAEVAAADVEINKNVFYGVESPYDAIG